MDKQLLITNTLTISAFSIVCIGMYFYFRKLKELRELGTLKNKNRDTNQLCPYCKTDLKWKLISILALLRLNNSIHKCPACSKQIRYIGYKQNLQYFFSLLIGLISILSIKYLFKLEGGTFQVISSLLFFLIILVHTTKKDKHPYWVANKNESS